MAITRELFEEVKLSTAEELLDQLSVHSGRLWHHGAETDWDWIFRGQGDAVWGLSPSSLRDGKLQEFLPFEPKPYQPLSPQARRDLEEHLMTEFASGVDAQGIAVPGDKPELRDKDLAHPTNTAWDFPKIEHHFMYALAQHYGIPTRFLDWSHSPLAAAYFACSGLAADLAEKVERERAAREGKGASRQGESALKSPERFAVWALSRLFVDRVARRWEPFVKIVTVPTSSNPNLHAQRGLFTLCGFRREESGDNDPPDLDAMFKGRQYNRDDDEDIFYPGPVMVKFTVPTSEARDLLRILAVGGVSAASIYPGHAGVVRAMKEKMLYHYNPPGSRP